MKNAARTIFQNNEMFQHLDAAGMDRAAQAAVRRRYDKGMTIFADGEPGDAIFGVISGQVQISARTPANRQIFLNLVGSGGVFGEIAVIDGLPRCASAIAATNVEVFRVCRDSFSRLMAADPLVMLGLLGVLCKHQRVATRLIIEEYAQKNVAARLAHGVLRLTNGNESPACQDDSLEITQAELAKFVFVSRQIVNYHLSEWESRGWVSKSRCRVVVTDRDALTALARNADGRVGNGETSLDSEVS